MVAVTCEGSFDEVKLLLNPSPTPVVLYKHNPQSWSFAPRVGNICSLPSGSEFGSVTIKVCNQIIYIAKTTPPPKKKSLENPRELISAVSAF